MIDYDNLVSARTACTGGLCSTKRAKPFRGHGPRHFNWTQKSCKPHAKATLKPSSFDDSISCGPTHCIASRRTQVLSERKNIW